jgi:hypothetical protein
MAREAYPAVFEPNEEYAELAAVTGFPWQPGGAFKGSESPLHPEIMNAVADDPILKIFAGPDG